MLTVSRDDIGGTAFDRLVREGLLHDVMGASALPADIRSTRALREHLLRPLVPGHAWVTGLAALWLYGFAPPPPRIDLAGPRSVHHPLAALDNPLLVYHGGSLDGLPSDAAFPRAATVTRACLDALAHNPPSAALPATASALRRRATSIRDLRRMVARMNARKKGRNRVMGLVEALAEL